VGDWDSRRRFAQRGDNVDPNMALGVVSPEGNGLRDAAEADARAEGDMSRWRLLVNGPSER